MASSDVNRLPLSDREDDQFGFYLHWLHLHATLMTGINALLFILGGVLSPLLLIGIRKAGEGHNANSLPWLFAKLLAAAVRMGLVAVIGLALVAILCAQGDMDGMGLMALVMFGIIIVAACGWIFAVTTALLTSVTLAESGVARAWCGVYVVGLLCLTTMSLLTAVLGGVLLTALWLLIVAMIAKRKSRSTAQHPRKGTGHDE